MYIKRIVIENLRCFNKLDFSFSRPKGELAGWNVITGDNASGKTTLLKAIALALVGPDTARTLQPSFSGWLRDNSESAVIAAEIVAGSKDSFTVGRRYERPFWSELSLDPVGADISLSSGNKYRQKGKGPTNGPWSERAHGWLSLGYGPFRRLYGSSPEAQRIMSTPGRVSRFATMFREDATLGECEFWLKELQHKKLENRPPETALLDSAISLLNDDFLRNGLTIHEVNSDGVWLMDSNQFKIALSDMSEGYRAALAMLMDILRHTARVHGSEKLVYQDKEGNLKVPHEGVVLIDEIDAHLHPEWQRMIGPWLKARFPNVQFIVTTHSAFICQAADKDSIYHLPAPGQDGVPFQVKGDDYRSIIKSKPDAIYLSPAFELKHTRSPRAVEARRRLATLNSKSSSSKLTKEEAQEHRQLKLFAD